MNEKTCKYFWLFCFGHSQLAVHWNHEWGTQGYILTEEIAGLKWTIKYEI